MGLLYRAYRLFGSSILFSCFAPFWAYTRITGRFGGELRERLGFIPPQLPQTLSGSPRIWLHAASLGEVKVAMGLKEPLEKLLPGSSVILSTSTEHGRRLAEEAFRPSPVIYAPVDTVLAVRRVLSRLRPDVMVFLETEIWPVWITEAKRMNIRVGLINGRISARSIRRYMAVQPFFREVLQNVDAFSMIGQEDADRIRRMGAAPHRLQVNGNAKYELLALHADPSTEREMRRILDLKEQQVVLVAGSTRSGEEEMILKAYQRILKEFPDSVLVIAPRHIVRVPAITAMLKARGIVCQLRTELGPGARRIAPVVLVDTFGELFRLYSVGTLNFCGASLVPLGGQNPLEPASWGKAVFYGPSMEDFADAKRLLQSLGAGIEVSDPEDFAQRAIALLKDPATLRLKGEKAREALLKNRGAAERHARVIAELARGRRLNVE
jgi:3-deoxy-D-manno-octulosonic-acid transferase